MSDVVGPQCSGAPMSANGPAGKSEIARARHSAGSSGGAGYGGSSGAAEYAIT